MAANKLAKLALVVLVVVVVVITLTARGGQTKKPQPVTTTTLGSASPSGPSGPLVTTTLAPTVGPTTIPTEPTTPEPEHSDDVDSTTEDVWRQINELSASSGLPAADIQTLTTQAKAFVVADLTGVGRENFPGYWGQEPQDGFRPQFTQVTPHAAGVTLTGQPDTAQVLVGLSAMQLAPDGTLVPVPVKRMFVYFVRQGDAWRLLTG